MTPLLDVTDAKVHFGGVHAVDGVSIQLQDGALHGLVGPNGSGKSTLLAALSRMIDLTDGRLSFKGHDYQRDSAPAVARMGIGRTFQAVRVMSSRSVLENVMLGADAGIFGPGIVGNWLLPWRTRRHERQCREMAMAAIERLELTGMENDLVGTLSYGTQRRGGDRQPGRAPVRRADRGHEPGRARRGRRGHAHPASGRPGSGAGRARHAD